MGAAQSSISLRRACMNGDLAAAAGHLASQTDPEHVNKSEVTWFFPKGRTALILCAAGHTRSSGDQRAARLEIMKLLVAAGADPNLTDRDSCTALIYLCKQDPTNLQAIQLLLDAKSDVDAVDPDNNRTPLHYACFANHGPVKGLTGYSHKAKGWEINVAVVEALLRAGADVNKQDSKGQHALSMCVRTCPAPEAVEALLGAEGLMVNLADREGKHALEHACKYNLNNTGQCPTFDAQRGMEVVKRLIAAGGAVERGDLFQHVYRPDAARLLVEAGAPLPPTVLISKLKADAVAERAALVTYLLEAGADPAVRDPDITSAYTALHWAARRGYEECCRALLLRGAQVDAMTEGNWGAETLSPLHLAAQYRHRQSQPMRALLEHGAAPNVRSSEGNTPLIALLRGEDSGNLDKLKLLLRYGASPQLRNNAGRTALDYARDQADDRQKQIAILEAPPTQSAPVYAAGIRVPAPAPAPAPAPRAAAAPAPPLRAGKQPAGPQAAPAKPKPKPKPKPKRVEGPQFFVGQKVMVGGGQQLMVGGRMVTRGGHSCFVISPNDPVTGLVTLQDYWGSGPTRQADPNKLRLYIVNPSKRWHAFLSHDWGPDEAGSSDNGGNHGRVDAVNTSLKQRGLSTWMDTDRMAGDVEDRMYSGINESDAVVVFVTANYVTKAGGLGPRGENDNCWREFNHATVATPDTPKLTVSMDAKAAEGAGPPSRWKGLVGTELGAQPLTACLSQLVPGTAQWEAEMDKIYWAIASNCTKTMPSGVGAQPGVWNNAASELDSEKGRRAKKREEFGFFDTTQEYFPHQPVKWIPSSETIQRNKIRAPSCQLQATVLQRNSKQSGLVKIKTTSVVKEQSRYHGDEAWHGRTLFVDPTELSLMKVNCSDNNNWFQSNSYHVYLAYDWEGPGEGEAGGTAARVLHIAEGLKARGLLPYVPTANNDDSDTISEAIDVSGVVAMFVEKSYMNKVAEEAPSYCQYEFMAATKGRPSLPMPILPIGMDCFDKNGAGFPDRWVGPLGQKLGRGAGTLMDVKFSTLKPETDAWEAEVDKLYKGIVDELCIPDRDDEGLTKDAGEAAREVALEKKAEERERLERERLERERRR